LLYIDPVECIDCALRTGLPGLGDFALDDLPEKVDGFHRKNAAYYGR